MTRRIFLKNNGFAFVGLFLPLSLQTNYGNLDLRVGDEQIKYKLNYFYKRGKIIKTPKGIKFKVVIWPSYAPWGKKYSLIVRSLDGKYSTNIQIDGLQKDVGLIFGIEK